MRKVQLLLICPRNPRGRTVKMYIGKHKSTSEMSEQTSVNSPFPLCKSTAIDFFCDYFF